MTLQKELDTYKKVLPTLLPENEGKFVVIHDSQVAGVFSSLEDALKIGYDKFGLDPFLVKKIEAVKQVLFFSRDLKLCPI